MPPKIRKVQLTAARNSKALKKKNATLLIASCDEDELSDCHDSDDDWHNDEFENLKQISQIAFDVMIENAKVPTSFTNKRPLVYIGNSERTQRRKKLAAKTATAGISNLNTFFSISQQIPHQSTKELANNLKQLERDQEQEGFKLILEDLKKLIADKSLIL